jgi:hypothetical protein
VALYLAKKNASRTINQKGGADKDETRKDTDKLPFNSKKLKKSGGPLKEVIICNQSLPNLADSGTYSIRICKIEEVGSKRMDSCTSVVRALGLMELKMMIIRFARNICNTF